MAGRQRKRSFELSASRSAFRQEQLVSTRERLSVSGSMRISIRVLCVRYPSSPQGISLVPPTVKTVWHPLIDVLNFQDNDAKFRASFSEAEVKIDGKEEL
jgi:hypothetical protein